MESNGNPILLDVPNGIIVVMDGGEPRSFELKRLLELLKKSSASLKGSDRWKIEFDELPGWARSNRESLRAWKIGQKGNNQVWRINASLADFPLGAIFVNALRIIASYGKYLRELVEKPVHDIGTTIRKLIRKDKTGYLEDDLIEPAIFTFSYS